MMQAERKRKVKNRAVQPDWLLQTELQDAAKAPRQVKTAVNTVETPVKTAKRPAQTAGQTMPVVIREIDQDYEGRLEEIKGGIAHDTLEMSGSRAVWPDVLAVYAVKTTSDPNNP